MIFISHEASMPQVADSFELGANYGPAFRVVKNRLDALGIKATERAIQLAVARKMDPEGTTGFVDFI